MHATSSPQAARRTSHCRCSRPRRAALDERPLASLYACASTSSSLERSALAQINRSTLVDACEQSKLAAREIEGTETAHHTQELKIRSRFLIAIPNVNWLTKWLTCRAVCKAPFCSRCLSSFNLINPLRSR